MSGMTIVFPNGTFRLLIAPSASQTSIAGQKEQAIALARERCATLPAAVAFLHVPEPRMRVLLLRTGSSGRWSVHGVHDLAQTPDEMPKLTVTD